MDDPYGDHGVSERSVEGQKALLPAVLTVGRDSLLIFFQCQGELVRTGSRLEAATGSLQAPDHFTDIHPLHQSGDTLRVAGTAANILQIGKLVILDIKVDFSGTDIACFIYHDFILRF